MQNEMHYLHINAIGGHVDTDHTLHVPFSNLWYFHSYEDFCNHKKF